MNKKQLGIIEYNNKHYKNAIRYFKDCLIDQNEDGSISLWIAKCYVEINQNENCDEELNRYLQDAINKGNNEAIELNKFLQETAEIVESILSSEKLINNKSTVSTKKSFSIWKLVLLFYGIAVIMYVMSSGQVLSTMLAFLFLFDIIYTIYYIAKGDAHPFTIFVLVISCIFLIKLYGIADDNERDMRLKQSYSSHSYTNTYKPSSSSSSSSSSYSTPDYGVKNYDDPDDFWQDHDTDFEDYEDAEDYWYDWN